MTHALGGANLRIEPLDAGRRRHAVQGHVDQRRDAAGGGRAGRRRETLPIGSTWIVDVDVRVDEPGHHDVLAGLDDPRVFTDMG